MTELPARVETNETPRPTSIIYCGYGTVLYRGYNFQNKSFLALDSYVAGAKGDNTVENRVTRGSVGVCYAEAFLTWVINFAIVSCVAFLVTALIGIPILSAITVKIAISIFFSFFLSTYQITKKSISPLALITEVNEKAFMNDLNNELAAGTTTVVPVSWVLVESLEKLLEKDVENRRDFFRVIGQKFSSNASDQELKVWMNKVSSIIDIDPVFPSSFIPLLNDHATLLESELRTKVQLDAEEARQLEIDMKTEELDLKQNFDEIDSTSALTGAFTYLGMDPDEVIRVAAEKKEQEILQRENKAKESFARHLQLEPSTIKLKEDSNNTAFETSDNNGDITYYASREDAMEAVMEQIENKNGVFVEYAVDASPDQEIVGIRELISSEFNDVTDEKHIKRPPFHFLPDPGRTTARF